MTPLRKRLWYPPNAVPDTGIDLRRQRSNVVPFRPRDITKPQPGTDPKPDPVYEPVPLIKNMNPAKNGGIAREDAPPTSRFGLREIRLAICEVWGISEIELVGRRRAQKVARPRQVAYAMSCRFTTHSLPTIGRSLDRDHTSVLIGARKVRHLVDAVAAELASDAPAIEWARALKRRIAPS